MPKTPHLVAVSLISALCLGAGIQPGLAAADPAVEVKAEAAADPEAAAAAEAKEKKEKKPGRWAESGRPPGRVISDRWGFYVGGYAANVTTDASIGSGHVLGTTIRVEDDLGLSNDDRAVRAEGFYRFNPRHGLDFGYWGLRRAGNQVLDEEIEFRGEVYSVGATVDTEFNTSWVRVAYKYSMVNTRRAEAGITAGLSTYQFKLGLDGQASIADPNGVLVTNIDAVVEDFLAPVPTFGFFLTYAMRPRLLFKMRADWMNLELSDLEGRLVDSTMGVEWYFTRHVGVGLLTNITSIQVKDVGEKPWSIDYRQRGWVGYFTFVFGSNTEKADRQKE